MHINHKFLETSRMRRFCAYLAMSLLIVGGVQGAVQQDRVALIIGNGRYKHSPRLKNPENDAAILRRKLEKCGFTVIHNSDSTNLTRGQFRLLLKDFHSRIKAGGVALFYYAGHGIQLEGKNYLIPVDCALKTASQAESECVPLAWVYGAMLSDDKVDRSKASVNIMLLDCCRDNPFKQRLLTRSIQVQTGLAPEHPPEGFFLSFAARADHVAVDGSGNNSPYSGALAKQLETKGLEIHLMMLNVANEVFTVTNEQQRPEQYGDLVKPFFFVPPSNVVETSASLPVSNKTTIKISPPNSENDVVEFIRRAANNDNEDYVNSLFPYIQLPMDKYQDQQGADRKYIVNDRQNYVKRWPNRKFQLISGPTITEHTNNDYTLTTEFHYQVSNPMMRSPATGNTVYTWKVHKDQTGELKITSLVERSQSDKTNKRKSRSRR